MARALLIKFKWKTNEVMDAIMNETDLIARVLKFDAHDAEMSEGGFTCESCYYEVEPVDIVFMPDCHHALCSECFSVYLVTKINQGADCFQAKCPNQKCENIVPPDIFKKLVDRKLFDKYDKYCYESVVNSS